MRLRGERPMRLKTKIAAALLGSPPCRPPPGPAVIGGTYYAPAVRLPRILRRGRRAELPGHPGRQRLPRRRSRHRGARPAAHDAGSQAAAGADLHLPGSAREAAPLLPAGPDLRPRQRLRLELGLRRPSAALQAGTVRASSTSSPSIAGTTRCCPRRPPGRRRPRPTTRASPSCSASCSRWSGAIRPRCVRRSAAGTGADRPLSSSRSSSGPRSPLSAGS